MMHAYSWPLRGLLARVATFFTQRLARAGVAGLLLALLPLLARAQATPPAWEVALSGNDNQAGTGTSQTRATATDARGNVFITGNFTGAVSFGSTRLVSAGTGTTSDVFVAKWDATAQAFTWATSGGGTGNDTGYGIAVSGAGVYVTGSFASGTSASIAGQALAGTGSGSPDVFVAKYADTSTGSTVATSSVANGWATSGGGTGYDVGYGIAVSGKDVYVIGYFDSGTSASFAGQVFAGAGNTDVFVAKYVDTSTGSTPATSSFANGWATSGGGTGGDVGGSIAVSGKNVYTTGVFNSNTSASFAGQVLAGAGSHDLFVAKYVDTSTGSTPATSSFANGWATSGGGTGAEFGIAIMASGPNVYVTGYFESGTNATIAGQPLAGAGRIDMFLAKYVDTSTGSTPATSSFANGWATSGGGTGDDAGQGIAVNGGSVYVMGYFASSSNAVFAGQALAGASMSTSDDLFMAKYVDTSTGSTPATSSFANGWATSGGGTGSDVGTGIVLNGQQVYAVGYIAPPATFGTMGFGSASSGRKYLLARVTDASTPLPVALTQFAATAEGAAAVRLTWATASEKNSAHFEVERSADGMSFATIGTVAAAGTTATARAYVLLDAALPTGATVLYYRLRQVDLDGTSAFSPVRSVAVASGLSLYPNPASGGAATLSGVAPGAAVQVLDALGRQVLRATVDAAGTARVAAGLAPGVYVVRAGAQALRLTVE